MKSIATYNQNKINRNQNKINPIATYNPIMKESRKYTSMFFDALSRISHVFSIEIWSSSSCQDAQIRLVIPFLIWVVLDKSISNSMACWFPRDWRISEWQVIRRCLQKGINLSTATKEYRQPVCLKIQACCSLNWPSRSPPPLNSKVTMMTEML